MWSLKRYLPRHLPLIALASLLACSKAAPREQVPKPSPALTAGANLDAGGNLDAAAPPPGVEAAWFSISCSGAGQRDDEVCVFAGRVTAVHPLVIGREPHVGDGFLDQGELPIPPQRALDVALDASSEVTCSAPRKRSRARTIRVVGGARIASAFREGAGICGWARDVMEPGLPGRPGESRGWEGEVFDGAGSSLAAFSFFLEADSPLASRWRLSREGRAVRRPLDEGGAVLWHSRVRVCRGDKSCVSTKDFHATLASTEGTFEVAAESNLTEGNVPVFYGKRDAYRFAAVRVLLP